MEEELILLDAWPSPFGMRVRLALAVKGIEYKYVEEDLRNKSPLLLQMNPVHKKIPVLIHNGKPIAESLIIIQYIDEVWPDKAPLLPSDPYHRSQARFWADFVDRKIYETAKNLMSPQEREKATKELIENLKILEEQLGDKEYFGGESIGYVDVAFLPFYQWFYTYEKLGNFSIEADCPKIDEWGKRCLRKDTISASIPAQEKLYGFYTELTKNLAK